MSKLFSACRRSPKLKEDVTEMVSIQPKVESRIPTPTSPTASRPHTSTKKPRRRELSPRRIAIVNARKANLMEKKAKENEQPELNTSPGLNLKRPQTPQGPPLEQDHFVGIPEVFGIQTRGTGRMRATSASKQHLFKSFLEEYEAAMVFFYDPRVPSSNDASRIFKKAARTTKRQNHAYAAINCRDMREICMAENIRSLPTYKLYSHGKFVGHYDCTLTSADDLKLYTETSPVVELPFKETSPSCAIQ